MARTIINNLSYHYRLHGSGEPILLLHGFTGSSLSWPSFANDHFSGMMVVTLDLPGHGQSDSPPSPERYAIDRVAGDIVKITDHLGLEQFSLLGYSMGGRLALYLALNYPEKISALVLESASPGIADKAERAQRQEWDYALAERIERDGILAFINYWERLQLFASQAAIPRQKRAKLRHQRLQNNPSGLANSLRGMGTGSQPSLWAVLEALSPPAQFLCGALDNKYVQINQAMTRTVPNAELMVIPGAGHNIHFEQPAVFTTAVKNFLKGTRRI